MESIYLLRLLPVEGGGSKQAIACFEDQAEQNYFAGDAGSFLTSRTGLLYRNLRAQFEYRIGTTPQFFSYLTRGKSRIPLGVHTEHGTLGFLPIEGGRVLSRTDKASIDSFLKTYNKAKVVVVSEDFPGVEALGTRIIIAPPSIVLF